jgi:hypothetical protein
LAEGVDSKALERALKRLRRERGLVETPTLAEFVEVYLGQHGGEPASVGLPTRALDDVPRHVT